MTSLLWALFVLGLLGLLGSRNPLLAFSAGIAGGVALVCLLIERGVF